MRKPTPYLNRWAVPQVIRPRAPPHCCTRCSGQPPAWARRPLGYLLRTSREQGGDLCMNQQLHNQENPMKPQFSWARFVFVITAALLLAGVTAHPSQAAVIENDTFPFNDDNPFVV